MATNSFGTVKMILGSDVANNGTFTAAYPTGLVQADFQGADVNTADEAMIVNNNDSYNAAQVDFSFGASTVTVTNKTGATLKAGSELLLYYPRGNRGTYRGPQSAAIVALTDNSGGTAADTIAAIGGTYSQTEVRNAVASLAAKFNALQAALKKAGITL